VKARQMVLEGLDDVRRDSHFSSAMKQGRSIAKKGRQIALRVGETLLSAIDAEVARLQRERPGATLHRSDAVREILHRTLVNRSHMSG
jgi:hypothetical protein